MCACGSNYSWRLAFGLQNLVSRHRFNFFGHNFTNPGTHASGGCTVSQVFIEVTSTHRPVASNICFSLLHCVTGMLPTVSFAENMLLQHFAFWCGCCWDACKKNLWGWKKLKCSLVLKDTQMFTYVLVNVNWDAVTSNLLFLGSQQGEVFQAIIVQQGHLPAGAMQDSIRSV